MVIVALLLRGQFCLIGGAHAAPSWWAKFPSHFLLSSGRLLLCVCIFQDGPRLTALLQSSLAMSGMDGGGGDNDNSGECLRSPVVGGDRPLLELFLLECRPERAREWRGRGAQVSARVLGVRRGGGGDC